MGGTKISEGEGGTALFLSKTPVLFRKSVIKYPMGVSFARCKKEDEEYAADGI